MRAALATLPPSQRQAIELAYFAGLSYPVVAAKMGTSHGVIASRMRLGLCSLRDALAGRARADDETGIRSEVSR